MPSFKGFIRYDEAVRAMLTAAIGTAWSPALGAPTRITRSREFDEVALLSFAWPVPRPFRDGIRAPVPPSPSIASVTPQAMPQGGDLKRPHSLSFFAIAFGVLRCISRRSLSESMRGHDLGIGDAVRA